jgi:hypothetical protein
MNKLMRHVGLGTAIPNVTCLINISQLFDNLLCTPLLLSSFFDKIPRILFSPKLSIAIPHI